MGWRAAGSDLEVRGARARGVVARTAGLLRGERAALGPNEERASAERAIADESEARG
jgi:hypothetical protein